MHDELRVSGWNSRKSYNKTANDKKIGIRGLGEHAEMLQREGQQQSWIERSNNHGHENEMYSNA